MKASLNLAQYYSNVDLKSIAHDKLVTKAGAQLGGIEEVIDWAPKYKGVLVAKIVSCIDHPDADRLHVCMVDDGGKAKNVKRDSKGLVQVVCGAPNARAGIFVAWLPPGSTVPASYNDAEPFVLEARELRGVVSNGMLASAKELDIADDHDGILEINPEEVGRTPKPGDAFVEYFGLDDFVLDFENKMFTHRPDCFGVLGIARELAGISGLAFKSPSWYLNEPKFETRSEVKLSVKNEAGKLVPRLMAVAMDNIMVGKSPVWLQAALRRMGMNPVNNVVDVTNYVMALTGQPLHAYDADKLGTHLTSRMAISGEKLLLLNGKEIELNETDIVIANADKVVGLAGIMGGSETEVDNDTKNIIIECATFDMYTIRRSSMNHGIFSDASARYTKGQSPLQNSRAVYYAMKNMKEIAGAKQSSVVYDVHTKLSDPSDVIVNAQFINERLGSNLSLKDIAKLLENVEFVIKNVPADKNRLHVRPPFWRTDIEMPEDVVEEIGRLYGYDQIPVTLPARQAVPAARNIVLDFKQSLRGLLSASGANEVLTYSFVHGDLMRKTGTDPDKFAFHLRNAISPDLQYYRTALMPSLLDKVRGNLRADMVRSDDNDFAIYEFGKAHVKDHLGDDAIPVEFERLALVFAADQKTAERKYQGSAFYQAKHYLTTLLNNQAEFIPLESNEFPFTSSYQIGRSAAIKIGSDVIGSIGEFNAATKKSLKLPDFSAGFELDLSLLHKHIGTNAYKQTSNFPKVQQDMTFEAPASLTFSDLNLVLDYELKKANEVSGINYALVARDIYQAEGSDKKRLTFRVWLSHPGKTLKTEETNHLLGNIAAVCKEKLSAERI